MQKYATISHLARITGMSLQTARTKKKAVERGIELGRYNHYAICDKVISIPVFLDAVKYYDWITDDTYEDIRDLLPPFNETDAMAYLGGEL